MPLYETAAFRSSDSLAVSSICDMKALSSTIKSIPKRILKTRKLDISKFIESASESWVYTVCCGEGELSSELIKMMLNALRAYLPTAATKQHQQQYQLHPQHQ